MKYFISVVAVVLMACINNVQAEIYSLRQMKAEQQKAGLSLTSRLEVQYTDSHYVVHLLNKDNVYVAITDSNSNNPKVANISLLDIQSQQQLINQRNISIVEITNSYFHNINASAYLKVTNKRDYEKLLVSFINL